MNSWCPYAVHDTHSAVQGTLVAVNFTRFAVHGTYIAVLSSRFAVNGTRLAVHGTHIAVRCTYIAVHRGRVYSYEKYITFTKTCSAHTVYRTMLYIYTIRLHA